MKFFNRVHVVTTTTGTGSLLLGAAATDNMLTLAQAGAANDDETTFVIEQGADFEVSRGIVSNGGLTLTRATVLVSKIGSTVGTTKLTLGGAATVKFYPAAELLSEVVSRTATGMAYDHATSGLAATTVKGGIDELAGLIGALATVAETGAYNDLSGKPDLSSYAATSAVVLKAGGTMTGALVLAADPSSSLHAATKQYVDGLLANVGKRGRVRAASTANLTISTALNNADTLDGVTLATGDWVLVKNQTAPAENGIYVVGVVPARAPEFDAWAELAGSLLAVAEGTVNGDTLWLCTSNFGGTLDTTAVAFSKMTIAGELLATDLGVTVQPYDADLADIAANVTAAGLAFIKAANVTAQTALINAATASLPGIVELATVAEAGAGTDAVRAVTPAGLFPAAATVASGTTCNIGAAASSLVQVTGTTTITAFDNVAAGIKRSGWFAGILTLTHNATSLILPGGANIVTAANDRFEAVSLGSGNWLVLDYVKASGAAVLASGGGWTAVGSAVATTSGTSVTFSSIPTDGTDFGFVFIGVKSAAGGALRIELSANNGSSWSSQAEFDYVDATNATYGRVAIEFYRAGAGGIDWGLSQTAATPTIGSTKGSYSFRCDGGINAVRFSLDASTFSAGSIQAYKR